MLLATVHVITHLQFFQLVLFTHGDDPKYAGRWSSLHVANNTLMVATALCVDGMMVSRSRGDHVMSSHKLTRAMIVGTEMLHCLVAK